MPHICRRCSRVNPDAALYCYHDGTVLDTAGATGPLDVGKQPFVAPFVFPSGHACRNFDQLALACNRFWSEACDLIREGFLAGFLGGMGRVDLALAAREAAKHSDPDLGLDDFLSKLPSDELSGPKLKVEPVEVNLGQLRPGQDVTTEVRLWNTGTRLMRGSAVVSGCDWLQLGEGIAARVFQFTDELRLPVQVRGKALRAATRPIEGHIIVETAGGKETVVVRASVPVTPFVEGVLAGSKSPREAATKARAAPKDAAPLFESGAVARWYEANGWTYPVLGPGSSGLGAVQQFFEALGLVQPPKVEISDSELNLAGMPGHSLKHSIKVTAIEARPVYAFAVSDQDWLRPGKVVLAGKTATIPLIVDPIPDSPGETLRATVTVTANGQQRFTVAVALSVGATPGSQPAEPMILPSADVLPLVELTPSPGEPPVAAVATAVPFLARIDPGSWPAWGHLVPLAVVLLALLGVIGRDLLALGKPAPAPAVPEEEAPDTKPHIGILFHDRGDALLEEATRRFGLVMLREKDPADPRKRKKLTFDEMGRSNNVCVKIDGKEQLFGHQPGKWDPFREELGNDEQGKERIGERSVFIMGEGKIAVAQQVEVIAGEQTRLLDTCLVRYSITNRDGKPHTVGLRFLLDTYIGASDGVPFTIPGDTRLCDSMLKFESAAKVPDFIQVLERQDLANPGTVAHLQLRLGGKLESPSRLTLGCWPDAELARTGKAPKALAQLTGWDVPVLPIHTLPPGDSAVTIYWDPKPLARGATREVGFSYGLGAIATGGEAKGKLALTVGGAFRPGGVFTLTAYVSSPVKGQTLRLELPEGFVLDEGDPTQPVPLLAADTGRRTSPVTWKVRSPSRAGTYTVKVTSSTGISQTQRVTIRSNRLFD